MEKSELVIVGGGIVGLSVGFQFANRYPDKKIVILEKEKALAHHQTGHNSGVLHSGIYYKPGSLKAVNCREGKIAMERFCAEHGIDYEICGKVIVATAESEIPAMERIYQRGQENGVTCEILSKEQLSELEPHVAGVKAIHVPEAGIVNYKQVCEKLADLVIAAGGEVRTDSRVVGIEHQGSTSVIQSSSGEIEAKLIVNCAGLHCDRMTKMGGSSPTAKIVPFRGEYYEIKPERQGLCRNLIYPVPDPKFPFLGVHFTRMIEGGVECGPNAVLAFAREGYNKLDVNFRDLFESLTYPGFIRMALKHWKMGMGEMWRSFSKAAFVRALQKLMPEIQKEDLVAAPAGIRAQAVLRDGCLVDDFVIDETESMLNVNNAPSPAATASLKIGDSVVEMISKRFD